MKKITFFCLVICGFHCKTIVNYMQPSEQLIKNSTDKEVLLWSYKDGIPKDSLAVKSNMTMLLAEVADGEQSPIYFYDSIRFQFKDNRVKVDYNCSIFHKVDSVALRKCAADNINIFKPARNSLNYQEKTRYSTYTYTIDSLDYQEAQ